MNNSGINLIPYINDIAKLRERGNFQTIKKEVGEARLRAFLLKLYPKYSLPEIEKIINIPDSTLERWFEKLDIPRERRHIQHISKVGNRNREGIVEDGGKIKNISTIKMTPGLAYLIGFSLGDGSIQKYSLEVFNKDDELFRHLYSIMKEYGTVIESPRRDYGLWKLRLNDIRVAGLVKIDKKINKSTIEYIFKDSKLAKMFVVAFWDAEGRVARQHNYFHIYLYNTNKYLIDKIGVFLKTRGIYYSIHSRFDSERKYFLKGRLVRTTKPMHRISIPKRSSLIWAREIGLHMVQSKKNNVVKEILSLDR